MKYMKYLTIWMTYHDDQLLTEYNLKETDTISLFKGNDTSVKGENINHLNKFYSELTTMYFVWKNRKESQLVGFCHYRRSFNDYFEIDEGQCQVLTITYGCNVFQQYKISHNFLDLYDAVEFLNKQYGNDNKYSKYLLNGKVLIPCCCFIMHYSDFEKLCEWLFPILFAWDKKNGLNMDPEKYMEKAYRDFKYDNVNYQCRAVAFLAERLISCYLITEMKPFCITKIY